jgi:acyl carrier protein
MLVSFLKNMKNNNMEREEIIERIKIIIKPFTKETEAFDNLSESTDFINDLKINSANLVDIVLDIEDAFQVVIDDQSMEKMLDVKSAIAIIESKLQQS